MISQFQRSAALKLALLAGLALTSGSAGAATMGFTTLDNPGNPAFNQLLGINDRGQIAGYFGSGAAGDPNQGYVISPPYTKYMAITPPGSAQAQVTGINNFGEISGFWAPTNTGSDANYGFIGTWSHGSFAIATVNAPLVGSTPAVTQLLGVNAHHVAVGFYNDADGNAHGFGYKIATAETLPVQLDRATSLFVAGLNAHGIACGALTDANGVQHGFVRGLHGGDKQLVDGPGAMSTQLLGINNANIAVGFYVDGSGNTHGLLYDAITGDMQTVDAPAAVPSAGGTVLNGLNNTGAAVGFYTDASGNVNGLLVSGVPASF